MDKFVTSKKSTYQKSHRKESVRHKYEPNPTKCVSDALDSNNGASNLKVYTQRTLTQHLLNTLTDESNPITHSDIGLRSDRVVSLTSGHQRADGHGQRQGYVRMRNQKLRDQREEVVSGILNNTRIYINGYLQDTTDIEMKRIITKAGGRALRTASNATHIVTSQHLSGTKTHRLLASSRGTKPYVVRPEWVTDSVAAGKQLREEKYRIF
ncbi:hypothetical protein BJV74DRAFT_805649 [Russula compacta]|nr:hypothetical protein BJV74DRAFT_805649 [Russula compacta]